MTTPLKSQQQVNAGHLAAEALAERGVDHVFFISGGHTYPLHQGLQEKGVHLLATRHEQAAVFMAEAWGRLSRKPGVAMVTAGPGFTNALTPIANARLANSPLLLIAGVVGLNACEKLDLQDMIQLPVIEPMVKKAFVCHKPERIKEFVDMAYRTCISGKPGPVYLELPVDVQNAMVDRSEIREMSTTPETRIVDRGKAVQLLEMLKKAKRPVIFAGSGAYYSDAGKELLQFMEKTGVPVFTALQGRGLVPDTHELCFEASLIIRYGACAHAMNNADLFVLLGNRICMYYGSGQLFNPDAKFAQVDIDPTELGRNRTIDLPIMSDVQALLQECLELLDTGKAKPGKGYISWVEELKKAEEESKAMGDINAKSDSVPIHPYRLAAEVNSYMSGENDIVVGDGGDTQVWMAMARTAVKEGHYLESGIYGCLGIGIPYAIAAKMMYPDKRVLNIIGDGSVGFNFMEFETAIRKNIPVVIVINNDQGWGMIRHSQKIKLGKPMDEGTEIGDINYHQFVECMGGFGIRVEKPGDIVPALDAAFASGKPACVNVMTDPTVMGPGAMALAMVSGYKIE